MRRLTITIDRNDEAAAIAALAEKNTLACEWSDKLSRADMNDLHGIIYDAVRQVVSKESVHFINCEGE